MNSRVRDVKVDEWPWCGKRDWASVDGVCGVGGGASDDPKDWEGEPECGTDKDTCDTLGEGAENKSCVKPR